MTKLHDRLFGLDATQNCSLLKIDKLSYVSLVGYCHPPILQVVILASSDMMCYCVFMENINSPYYSSRFACLVVAVMSFMTAFGAVIVTGVGAITKNNDIVHSAGLFFVSGIIFGVGFILAANIYSRIEQANELELATVKEGN